MGSFEVNSMTEVTRFSLLVSALCYLFIRGTSLGGRATNIDEIICDHAEPNPALHSVFTFVAAAIQAMSALGDADASLTSDSPFSTDAETSASSVRVCVRRFWWSDWERRCA
jgi:hypothetical protein